MSATADDVSLPAVATCPSCGRILGDVARLDSQPNRWECRHCRRTWGAPEVFSHV